MADNTVKLATGLPTTANATETGQWDIVALAICFLVAVTEGFDLVIVGLTGPAVSAELGLSPSQFGLSATIVMIGFLFGSIFGGRLGDTLGCVRVMMAGIALAAAASLAIVFVTSVNSFLVFRFLSGIGIGLVYPNIMVRGASAVPPSRKARAIAIVSCGGSLGSLAAGLMLLFAGDAISWRTFFAVGAMAGVLLLPLAAMLLHRRTVDDGIEPAKSGKETTVRTVAVLFGSKRLTVTLLIWIINFITSFIYYLIAYWLPSFVAQRGLHPSEIGFASTTLSISAMIGGLCLSAAYDRRLGRSFLPLLVFVSMSIAIASFAFAQGRPAIYLGTALIGLFLFGGQMLVYGLSALSYPAPVRSTGLGFAHAAGRLGGIASPIIVGATLDAGFGQQTILLTLIAPLMAAGCCAFFVSRWILGEPWGLPRKR